MTTPPHTDRDPDNAPADDAQTATTDTETTAARPRTTVHVRPSVDLLMAAYNSDDCDAIEATVDRALALYAVLDNPNEMLADEDSVAGVPLAQPASSDADRDQWGLAAGDDQ